MKSKISGLDWLRLAVVSLVFVGYFWFIGGIFASFLWAYVTGVILFRTDNKLASYLALGFLIVIPIALSMKLDELAEALAVNVYYLLCIMVFSEIWSNHKLAWLWLENILDRGISWVVRWVAKIKDWVWVSGISLIVLVLVSGRYFIKSEIPHNSFLDMGGGVVNVDIWKQFSIGWFYQFGQAWNILTSNWAVLDTRILSWLAGDFYLGIKIHQFNSIVIAGIGSIVLYRAIMPKLENRIAGILAQILVALVYALNPFFLSVLSGVVEFGVAYSLLPWIVWAWLRIIRKNEVKWWENILRIIVLGVILSFATLVSGITLVFTNVLPLMVVMLGMASVGIESRREFIRRGILFFSLWLVVGLMGLHVLVPTFFGYRQSDGILDENRKEERIVPFVKDFYSPTPEELIYLQNKEGIVSEEIGYSLRSVPLENRLIWLFWVSLAMGSVFWIKKNKYILPLWIGSGLAGYLALGYSNSWLYRVLNEYFPYFWGLRTPGRFMMVFALGVSLLGAVVWYYIANEFKSRAWKLSSAFAGFVAVLLVLIAVRYQAVQMYTFRTVPSMDYHMEGVERAKKILDELNPNMEYRILDLTRDDDGSWNHTRVMSEGQRFFNEFDKVLMKYPAKDWAKILRDYNVKYIIFSGYDDYCEDRLENDKNLISCYLLQKRDGLSRITSTVEGYSIYEVKDVKAYISGEGIEQNFSYNPIVKTGAENQKVRVAEIYSPQFQWTCNDGRVVESNSEKNGLIQASILPANSECKFGYHKSWAVRLADWIFYGLFGLAVGSGFWTIGKFVVRRR